MRFVSLSVYCGSVYYLFDLYILSILPSAFLLLEWSGEVGGTERGLGMDMGFKAHYSVLEGLFIFLILQFSPFRLKNNI